MTFTEQHRKAKQTKADRDAIKTLTQVRNTLGEFPSPWTDEQITKMSEVLQCSPGSVRTKVSRAISRVRRLKDGGDDSGMVTRSFRVNAGDWETLKTYAEEQHTTVSAILAGEVRRLVQKIPGKNQVSS